MALCSKTKINAPPMYEVPDKETVKSEFPYHLSAAKHGYASKKGSLAEVFNTFFTS